MSSTVSRAEHRTHKAAPAWHASVEASRAVISMPTPVATHGIPSWSSSPSFWEIEPAVPNLLSGTQGRRDTGNVYEGFRAGPLSWQLT